MVYHQKYFNLFAITRPLYMRLRVRRGRADNSFKRLRDRYKPSPNAGEGLTPKRWGLAGSNIIPLLPPSRLRPGWEARSNVHPVPLQGGHRFMHLGRFGGWEGREF